MRISQQVKEETRERILAMATQLFLSKGFEDTTTRDIAAAAGLATGTLFNYFPSKETLAMSMVNEALSGGIEDYRQRCCDDEDLVEALFLFVTSGLRRLRPLRPFLGPVLERSLSPFPRKAICPEGESARQEHLAEVQNILGRHGFTAAPDYVAMTIYWSLYLGILAFWANDESPQQEATWALIDYSTQLFVQTISGTNPCTGAGHAD